MKQKMEYLMKINEDIFKAKRNKININLNKNNIEEDKKDEFRKRKFRLSRISIDIPYF